MVISLEAQLISLPIEICARSKIARVLSKRDDEFKVFIFIRFLEQASSLINKQAMNDS